MIHTILKLSPTYELIAVTLGTVGMHSKAFTPSYALRQYKDLCTESLSWVTSSPDTIFLISEKEKPSIHLLPKLM